jgi:hypothetical protein
MPAEGFHPRPPTHLPRHEIEALAVYYGADLTKAERVAEAALRRAQARDEGRMFIYVDVEYELEDLYRASGASAELITAAKQEAWDAARQISEQRGVLIEEALFFCFHEAADAYRDSAVAEAA